MGTMGLALPWEARISLERVERGPVEPRETTAGVSSSGVQACRDDSGLAAACRAGDLRAFEELYRLQGARMKSMARNLLGTRADAEDAVQDTFLKIQRSIATFRGQSSFLTWSFRILINTCYDERRSKMRKREVSQDEQEDGDIAQRPVQRAGGGYPSLEVA